jgi:Zn ribbon nucleic-acid-binding protein
MKACCPDCGERGTLDVFHDGEVACVECGHSCGYIF